MNDMLRALCFTLFVLVGLSSQVPALDFGLPELGIQPTGSCRALVVRNRANNTQVPIGCVDTGSSTFTSSPGNLTVGTLARVPRIYVGGAAPAAGGDWLGGYLGTAGTSSIVAQVGALSNTGEPAIIGGCRTSDSTNTGSQGCWGGGFFVFNNNATQVQTAYGQYVEARRSTGAGILHGQEVNPVNTGEVVDSTPYAMVATGVSVASWLSCGRPDVVDTKRCSAAVAVVNNGNASGRPGSFRRGIVYGSDSLDTSIGVIGDQGGIAMSMAMSQNIAWNGPGGDVAGISASITGGASKKQGLRFSDAGSLFLNSAAKTMFGVAQDSAYVNGMFVQPTSAGGAPTIQTAGDDANIDLWLKAKGGGRVSVQGTILNISNGYTPPTSTAPCTAGDSSWDATYEYRCIAANTWARTARASGTW